MEPDAQQAALLEQVGRVVQQRRRSSLVRHRTEALATGSFCLELPELLFEQSVISRER